MLNSTSCHLWSCREILGTSLTWAVASGEYLHEGMKTANQLKHTVTNSNNIVTSPSIQTLWLVLRNWALGNCTCRPEKHSNINWQHFDYVKIKLFIICFQAQQVQVSKRATHFFGVRPHKLGVGRTLSLVSIFEKYTFLTKNKWFKALKETKTWLTLGLGSVMLILWCQDVLY